MAGPPGVPGPQGSTGMKVKDSSILNKNPSYNSLKEKK
jgi:hypothetical protein